MEQISAKSTGVVELFAPAKINLFLAITGKREDDYHELCTVLAKVSTGDVIQVSRNNKSREVNLKCPRFKELETPDNLVSQAVSKWFQESGECWGVDITLKKNILPMSGLGGGSSDAVSTLLGMNELGDCLLSEQVLLSLAEEIGSDCPSFFNYGPCLAEGRGEHVRPIEQSRSLHLCGQQVLLFRPNIGLSTAAVYADFSRKPINSSKEWARERVSAWENGVLSIEEFLHNDLERPVFKKHRYFLPLFNMIQQKYGLHPKLSGSGSCCFVLLPQGFDQLSCLEDEVIQAWGKDVWLQKCKIIA